MRAVTLVLASALLTAGMAPAWADAQPSPVARERLEQWRQATPEQRLELCKQAVAERQAMSPEQKEKLRGERRARWEAMSPERREEMKARMKAGWTGLSDEERRELRGDPQARCEIMAKHWQDRHGPAAGPKQQ